MNENLENRLTKVEEHLNRDLALKIETEEKCAKLTKKMNHNLDHERAALLSDHHAELNLLSRINNSIEGLLVIKGELLQLKETLLDELKSEQENEVEDNQEVKSEDTELKPKAKKKKTKSA